MKLKHLIDPVAVDMDTLLRVKAPDLDRSELDTTTLWALLHHVSIQRAYDDSHPGFQNGSWTRILPFDGRDYCFYYEGGANDSHVSTLLRHVKTKLIGMENGTLQVLQNKARRLRTLILNNCDDNFNWIDAELGERLLADLKATNKRICELKPKFDSRGDMYLRAHD